MDQKVLFDLSYGLYIISTEFDGKKNAQIANVGGQITADPPKISICLNKQNLTTQLITKSKSFILSILSENTSVPFIGSFGFRSGKEVDKFAGINFTTSKNKNLPVVNDNTTGYIELEVEQIIDLDSYYLFIANVLDAQKLTNEKPMTYAYYHEVKGGLTSKNAPNYIKEEEKTKKESEDKLEMKQYKCNVCGYVYDPKEGDPDRGINPGTPFENLPEDWTCPICGVNKSDFEAI